MDLLVEPSSGVVVGAGWSCRLTDKEVMPRTEEVDDVDEFCPSEPEDVPRLPEESTSGVDGGEGGGEGFGVGVGVGVGIGVGVGVGSGALM